MEEKVERVFRGFPIDWEGDGIYAYFNVSKTYVHVVSISLLENMMRSGMPISYVSIADTTIVKNDSED